MTSFDGCFARGEEGWRVGFEPQRLENQSIGFYLKIAGWRLAGGDRLLVSIPKELSCDFS